MDKRPIYARSRAPGRSGHIRPDHHSKSGMDAARQVARHFVSAHWPALANIEPEVTLQHNRRSPSLDLVSRLGMSADEVGQQRSATTYTFTFASQCGTADGAMAPLVAAITIDGKRRIIKTSLSK